MPKFRTILSSVIFVIFFSISLCAQTAPPKSVLINTAAFFDEKAGITKLLAAQKQINGEFAAKIKAFQNDGAKIQAIAIEIQNLQKQPVTQAIQSAMAAKQDEGESLQRNVEFRKTELEAEMSKRREALIGPISFDIGKAISDFGKKNGYGAIFDASKLAESGALLFVADSVDITKDFISYYNARAASVPVAK